MARLEIRRVFRVFPAYLFCLAIIASLAALGQNHFSQVTAQLDAFAWVANLLTIQDYVGRPAVLGVSSILPLEFAWYALFLGYALTAGRRYIAELSIGFSILILIVAVASMLADAPASARARRHDQCRLARLCVVWPA